MLEIFVDADACPVKDEIVRVAERHDLAVHMVSNRWMLSTEHPLVRRVVVPEGPDQADDWIAEHCGSGDVVVTADIPLAGRCLEAGARVLGPTGKPFDADNIGMARAMRDLNAELRDTGAIRGGGPSFGKADRSRFLSALENAIQAIKRGR
ncbi:MAG TPA: YaiI/YqxD family protein [Hyphomicrobiales bacterium]|nr:YaiI/YqxD family protein [Hyphomicrobiales bacterium]